MLSSRHNTAITVQYGQIITPGGRDCQAVALMGFQWQGRGDAVAGTGGLQWQGPGGFSAKDGRDAVAGPGGCSGRAGEGATQPVTVPWRVQHSQWKEQGGCSGRAGRVQHSQW